jgi:cell division septum initiation protein DivIVA
MTTQLYVLASNYADLARRLDEAEDEQLEEEMQALAAELAASGESLALKADAVASIMRSFERAAEAYQAEADRLDARAKAAKAKAKRLKQYIENQLEVAQLPRLDGPRFSMWLANNPASVEVVNEQLVPGRFKTITVDVDKRAILAHAKQTGEVVPGVRIVKDRQSLRIR